MNIESIPTIYNDEDTLNEISDFYDSKVLDDFSEQKLENVIIFDKYHKGRYYTRRNINIFDGYKYTSIEIPVLKYCTEYNFLYSTNGYDINCKVPTLKIYPRYSSLFNYNISLDNISEPISNINTLKSISISNIKGYV